MFEALGIAVVWCVGLAVAAFAPFVVIDRIFSTGDGLSDIALSVVFGKVAAAAYILATVVYLWMT